MSFLQTVVCGRSNTPSGGKTPKNLEAAKLHLIGLKRNEDTKLEGCIWEKIGEEEGKRCDQNVMCGIPRELIKIFLERKKRNNSNKLFNIILVNY